MPSPTLVLVATSDLSPSLRRRLSEAIASGAMLVAWEHKPIVQDRFPSPAVGESLEAAGLEYRRLADCVDPEDPQGVDWDLDERAIRWFKSRGRTGLDGTRSFREVFRHGTMALWWWAELYLYHETPLRALVRDVLAVTRLVESTSSEELVLVRPSEALARGAEAVCRRVEILGGVAPSRLPSSRTTRLALTDLGKMLGTGLKSLARKQPQPRADGVQGLPRVFFLSHASMWRVREDPESGESLRVEMYFDRVIPEVAAGGDAVVVAFGPPVPFKTRSASQKLAERLEVTDGDTSGRAGGEAVRSIREYFRPSFCRPLTRAFADSVSGYRRFRAMDRAEEWLSVEGVSLGDEALRCVRDTFWRQFPWAIRVHLEVSEVLRVEKPRVMVLYAESSGLGRAAIQACRDAGVATVAIQHGIMYPQYYSHEHEPDELVGDDAVPIADVTTVFGRSAEKLLRERSCYEPSRIVVSGSPKFDALLASSRQLDRAGLRARLSIDDSQKALVLATRFIAVGPVLEELIRAVESDPRLMLLIKPHPAESVAPYREAIAGLRPERTRLVDAGANLLELLVATDGLVTVDSFASSEALVVGRPVLVINLPSNLSELVERGCAVGVPRGASIGQGLGRLLFDEVSRADLERARKDYLEDFAGGADGGSTRRIVETIHRIAEA